MHDSLASYWNTPENIGARAFLCWAEGMIDRETVSVLVYNMGPGERSQNGRHPNQRGNGRHRNIPLVGIYLRLFSQRHPRIVNT